ncbi:MAG: hypothetical protein GF346_09510 [Candidatus Eisenbacteria bacterium]|nr:hypothetical protein [Candidatus Latescibacterota bacterium]MBD3302669.1 hypothetical protein [Candidatus Eisenbacteria bacterium]
MTGAAVKDGYAQPSIGAHGVTVLDISEPQFPWLVTDLDISGYASNCVSSGDYLYVADWSGGLRIVDVRSPEEPQIVGSGESGPDGASPPHGVAVRCRGLRKDRRCRQR